MGTTIIILVSIAFTLIVLAFFSRKKKSTLPLTENGMPKFTPPLPPAAKTRENSQKYI